MLSKLKLVLSTFGENRSTGVAVVLIFPEIFGIRWSWFLMNEIGQKFIYKIYIIRNNDDAIWVHEAQYGVLLFRFFQNSCGSSILDTIAWNHTKFCMQYTYYER